MGLEKLKNDLMEAGNKHDGHVTNGSLEEQLKVFGSFLSLDLDSALEHLHEYLDEP